MGEDAWIKRTSVCILRLRAMKHSRQIIETGTALAAPRSDSSLMLAFLLKEEQRQWLDPLVIVESREVLQ